MPLVKGLVGIVILARRILPPLARQDSACSQAVEVLDEGVANHKVRFLPGSGFGATMQVHVRFDYNRRCGHCPHSSRSLAELSPSIVQHVRPGRHPLGRTASCRRDRCRQEPILDAHLVQSRKKISD